MIKIGRSIFNVETLKGKTEEQIRKEKSGFPDEMIDILIDTLKKDGLIKIKKKKKVEDNKEGGE